LNDIFGSIIGELTSYPFVSYNRKRDDNERPSMTALFVALGIMVLALLTLLLWFVPRLLQQQVVRVSDESAQLREMLLDLLSEQEAVTIRQTQLSAAIAQLQARFDVVTPDGGDAIAMIDRMNELQHTLQTWAEQRNVQPVNLDGGAVAETIDAVLVRLDAMQTQMRDTATIVDEGVLIGIRQLSDRVHALQIQLETWVDALSGQQSSDTQLLTTLQDHLQHIQSRIEDTRGLQSYATAESAVQTSSFTEQLATEPATSRLDDVGSGDSTPRTRGDTPLIAYDESQRDRDTSDADGADAASRDTPPQSFRS
jgi:hypothetical protein